MTYDAIASFLLAFSALVSIVNPLGGAVIYSQVTADRTHAERVTLAWQVAFYSAIVMLTALWAGAPILSFFGVSLAALRIAGGLVVAARAWELLLGPEQQESRKQEQAASATRKDDVAFFPLTLPFTTGPGTISVAIALSASGPGTGATLTSFFVGASLAAVAVAVTVGACYAQADRLVALLGPGRSRVVARLAAFILLCVGVQILLLGVEDAVRAMGLTR
jgi:multiple antibiotic resistance protein